MGAQVAHSIHRHDRTQRLCRFAVRLSLDEFRAAELYAKLILEEERDHGIRPGEDRSQIGFGQPLQLMAARFVMEDTISGGNVEFQWI